MASKGDRIDSKIEDGHLIFYVNNKKKLDIDTEGDDEDGQLIWKAFYILLRDYAMLPQEFQERVQNIIGILINYKIEKLDDFAKIPGNFGVTIIVLIAETQKAWRDIRGPEIYDENDDNNELEETNKFPSKNN